MPLFEHRCRHCGFSKEAILKYPPPDEIECPVCGGGAGLVPSVCAFLIPGFKDGQAVETPKEGE
jgi:putative FmdB family regulatory protein